VDHPVAVEGVVAGDGQVERVLGVADVEPVEVGGDGPLHHLHVVGRPLGGLGPPRAGAVGVVVVDGQRGAQLVDDPWGDHGSIRSTMNEQVVAVLPPMLSVPKRLAPSTWVPSARRVTWRVASSTMRTPVAPTGWPPPIR